MKVADKLGHAGTGLSFLCLIHCIAFPFLVTILPVIGLGFLLTGKAEKITLAAACALTAITLWRGFRIHRSFRGFLLLLGAIMYYWLAMHDSRKHLLYLCVGGISLAYANIENRYLRRICTPCHDHKH